MPDTSSPDSPTEDLESLAHIALRTFITESTATASEDPHPIEHHQQRTPFFDLQYDERFTQLTSFPRAVEQIGLLPDVRKQYGEGETKRLTLQLLYAYFDAAKDLSVDEECFALTWSRFQRERAMQEWRHVGVTVLQNFETSINRIEIADGVAICIRILEHFQGALTQQHLKWLIEDCEEGALGSHALIVEHREPKNPENVIRRDSYHPFLMMQRALQAVRLLKQGNVRTGRFHWLRPTLIPAHESGRSFAGSATWEPGTKCQFDQNDLATVRDIYSLLVDFETSRADAWKNVATALRWFTAIFDNAWNNAADTVIDAVIVIEALLGTDQEITYRLSTRVAGLLANDDEERIAFYRMMKLVYETRSTIVHGGELKDKHRAVLDDMTSIMEIVRRLMLGFVRLATGDSTFNSRRSLMDNIDIILLHSGAVSLVRRFKRRFAGISRLMLRECVERAVE